MSQIVTGFRRSPWIDVGLNVRELSLCIAAGQGAISQRAV